MVRVKARGRARTRATARVRVRVRATASVSYRARARVRWLNGLHFRGGQGSIPQLGLWLGLRSGSRFGFGCDSRVRSPAQLFSQLWLRGCGLIGDDLGLGLGFGPGRGLG